MGVGNSSLTDLPSNVCLRRLVGVEHISANEPFWIDLLDFRIPSLISSDDYRAFEDITRPLLKSFTVNNCSTSNFQSLICAFISRAVHAKSTEYLEMDSLNECERVLFLVRSTLKYFAENLSEEVIVAQFSANLQKGHKEGDTSGEDDLIVEFIRNLGRLLINLPSSEQTYRLNLEVLNCMLILLSPQMFQTKSARYSQIFGFCMSEKCGELSVDLVDSLLRHFIENKECPSGMTRYKSYMSSLTGGIGRLWSAKDPALEKYASDRISLQGKLLANQSLKLLLVLTNHWASASSIPANPYRDAVFKIPTVKDAEYLQKLYDSITSSLHSNETTLLLYLLLHKNKDMVSFILSQPDLDNIVLPLTMLLVDHKLQNGHHVYMVLIILLILSEHSEFNQVVHRMPVKDTRWINNRSAFNYRWEFSTLTSISLGSLIVITVIRIVKANMNKMADKYLHTNCMAVLANMSSYFYQLNQCATEEFTKLFNLLVKKRKKLLNLITQKENVEKNEDLEVVEEIMRMLLELINCCLYRSMPSNSCIVYSLLHMREIFEAFQTHPLLQDLIKNLLIVIEFFMPDLNANDHLSQTSISNLINLKIPEFKRDTMKKFPDLRFKYVEEEEPEEFFSPYVWSLVYHSSNLYFDASRIQVFSLQSSHSANA